MKIIFSSLLVMLAMNAVAFSPVVEETLYQDMKQSIESGRPFSKSFVSFDEQKLFVDALEDSLFEQVTPAALEQLESPSYLLFSLVERLRLGILNVKYRSAAALDQDLLADLMNEVKKPDVDTKLIYVIAAQEKLLASAGAADLVALAKLNASYNDVARSVDADTEDVAELVTDIYFNTPDVSTYMDGEYATSVKIFMFCRQNRLYPCLMVMKNIKGEPHRNADGNLWSHKVLASAVTGLPSYQRNGNTPAGILTIDSVMPYADSPMSYGKFRRMMLNFVPKSKDEVLYKSLLPKSSWDSDWWSSSTVARDIGRNLFRIHGTGRINKDPNTPYFPFNRTHGCIANRENTYGDVTYVDQRVLLDSIMTAMELEPKFENEPKIKGILYLMEIEDRAEPVALADLDAFGIK